MHIFLFCLFSYTHSISDFFLLDSKGKTINFFESFFGCLVHESLHVRTIHADIMHVRLLI